MRISWSEKLTNEIVLEKVESERQLYHYQKETLEICWA